MIDDNEFDDTDSHEGFKRAAQASLRGATGSRYVLDKSALYVKKEGGAAMKKITLQDCSAL